MMVFDDFEQADAAKTEGFQICGTLLKSGEPRYFLMPTDAADEQIRDAAFSVRNGRPISSYETMLLSMVQKVSA